MAIQQKLQIVIDAENRADAALSQISGKLSGLQKNVESMEPAFKKMATVGAVAFAGIGAAVGLSVKAYAESERSQRQLEHAIIGVSKGTKDQVQQVNDLTMALQKKAGIDGDALNAGIAQLSTFGLQSKTVVALTKSLADLTVNQKGVTASTDDYIGSANIMQKALNGQFGKLELMGIRFTPLQQKLIQFGTETERVAALNEGFAQNLRETTDTVSGYDVSMAKLNQQFGEIQETIGKALQPALTKLAEAILPVMTKMTEWADKNPELVTKIIIVSGAIAALVTGIGLLGLAMPAIITGFGLLLGPIGLIVGGITALIALLAMADINWTNLMNTFDEKTGILTAIKDLWNDLVLLWTDMVMPALLELWEALKPLQPLLTAIAFVLGGALVIAIRLAIEGIKILAVVVASFVTVGAKVATFITDVLVGAFKGVGNTVMWVIEKVEALINAISRLNVMQGAKNILGSVGSSISSALSGRAIGGPVSSGQSYMVGENGPELFTPNTFGRISSNKNLGGDQINITITGNSFLGKEDVARTIADELMNQLKLTNRIALQ
jgi:Holliday junction resolvasome RuvABC endonuclease subunit